MSWFGAIKSDDREARRPKLEQERLERLQRAKLRAQQQKKLQDLQLAQQQLDQACQELLSIDPDILAGEDVDIPASEISELLAIDNMTEFQSENGEDGATAMDNLRSVQCPFNKEDIEFWFSQLEGQLEVISIKSQWLKRIALQRFLPVEIQSDVKSLFKLTKTQAGDDIYLKIKKKLLELYGPKPEDAYIRAKNRVMTGLPSQLGAALIDDLCDKPDKLNGCCCAKIVWGLFRENLPIAVRNHIAELEFNKDTYLKIFQKADQVYASNQGQEPPNVARATVAAATSSAEVAAVSGKPQKNRFYKNRNQNGQGGGQNNQQGGNQNKNDTPSNSNKNPPNPKNKGRRHETAKGDDDKLCPIHFKWGLNGNYCAAPWKCPMKDVYKSPQ